MLILPEPFFLVVLIPACGDVALCFDVCSGGGGDVCKRWDLDESSKRKRTLLSSNSRRSLYDWGWALSDCEWVLKSQKAYISWCWWLHKSFCWHWHSCFAVLWPQDRKWHSPWWPCFSSVNDFAISFVEQTQVLVITWSFLLCCFSCTCFSLINYSALSVRRREKHGSCSSIEGHHWLHRSRTAQACTHLCEGSIGRARCECTTRTLILFAGVEQKPHVQTKLDNLLVFQSLFKYRKILGFSESLKQSCLNFLLSGFHAWIFLSQVFYTGATVNLTHDDVVLKSDSVVKSECDKTLEEITRRRVNCLPWLGSLPLRQAEHSSRSCARPNMFALQTSQSKALYSTGFPDASVIPTATRKFTRLRKLTDKSTSLWSMPTLWVHDTAEFIPIPLNMVSDGQNLHLLVRHVLCVSRFMNVLTRYSAEQRHVSQLRGDTSDLVIDDKEVTIFRTSSTGSWRRIRR